MPSTKTSVGRDLLVSTASNLPSIRIPAIYSRAIAGVAAMKRHGTAGMFGALVALSPLVSKPVWASDGVLEINQIWAAGPGCIAGDAAGYPVAINGAAGPRRRNGARRERARS